MGLAEKRKILEMQEKTFPARVQEIAEICGKPIPYEIDWASVADDAEALNVMEFATCHHLNMALRVICMDALGKEAIAEGLKLIKLQNVADPADMKISFENGVLEMHCAYAKMGDGRYSDHQIRAVLEKGL
jgi:hypothetical protein